MKFIFADSLDYVDPNFDFIEDRSSPSREIYWDDKYPHEMMHAAPYDGMLVSKAIVGGSKVAGRYTNAQAMMFNRVGAREFLRYRERDFPGSMMIGDCGAFSYHKMEKPPYSPAEMIDFYGDGEFTHGCSVDHVIFDFVQDDEAKSMAQDQLDENRRRFEITSENAELFLKESKRLGNRFTPMGVIQGWSPGSMAQAALRLKKMGYTYVAVGGMVPLRTPQIKTALQAIRELIGNELQMHILGFAKADQINEFKNYHITSFDSTSPLIRAFKDSNRNYYVSEADGTMSYYSAIRIPQALDNRTLKDLAKEGKFSQEDFIKRERLALDAIRAFDAGTVDLEEALDVIMAYSGPLLIGKDEYLNEKDIRKRDTLEARYRETLQKKPWKSCSCAICQDVGVEAIIFRGGNRNRRRGFHNLEVYHQHLKKIVS